jgi:hypothetical protein
VRAPLLAFALLSVACSKPNESSSLSTAEASVESAAGSAHPVPSGSASSRAPTPEVQAWSGRYSASPGGFYVPEGSEWAGVKFRGEDASVGLGEGAMTVSITREGRVAGTVDGPLGPLRVTGELAAKAFSAALVSSEPATGFSGTAIGTEANDRITGTMRLSLPTGNVLREATFTLERSH